MATLSPLTGVNDQWDITLRISPERVLEGNDVQLEVILFHRNLIGDPPYGNFSYIFNSPDPRIKAQLVPRVIRNPNPRIAQTSLRLQFPTCPKATMRSRLR